jgi:hypothetical protein
MGFEPLEWIPTHVRSFMHSHGPGRSSKFCTTSDYVYSSAGWYSLTSVCRGVLRAPRLERRDDPGSWSSGGLVLDGIAGIVFFVADAVQGAAARARGLARRLVLRALDSLCRLKPARRRSVQHRLQAAEPYRRQRPNGEQHEQGAAGLAR